MVLVQAIADRIYGYNIKRSVRFVSFKKWGKNGAFRNGAREMNLLASRQEVRQ
jgi:hypothetical protein